MSKLGFKALGLALTLTCTGVSLLTGCSSSSAGETHEKSDAVGTIKLALSTTGADGATYAFPSDAYLIVQGSAFTDWVYLYGNETTLNRTLATGTYTATLYFGSGTSTLVKTENGTTSNVSATWTNPQPVTLNIVKGQTTPIALHFTVKGLGDVTFDTGTLAITADVQKENSPTFANATATGTTNMFYLNNADDTAAYAAPLHVDQSVDLPTTWTYQSTSAWAQTSGVTVCQNGKLTGATASGSAGLIARMEEIVGSDVSFCVQDNGASDVISLYPYRYNVPAPADQTSFLPDAGYNFNGGLVIYTGDVYDGTTLKQTAMQNLSFTNAFFYHEVFDSSYTLLSIVEGYTAGTLAVTP